MLPLNQIYHESCEETLKRLPDNSVNLVITSPPYNMNLRIRNGKYCSRQIVKELTTKYDGFDDNFPIDEFYDFHSKILKELIRVSDIVFYNISIVTGSKRAFFKLIGEFNEQLKDIIVWDKGYAQPSISEKTLNRQSELILVFEKNGISRRFQQGTFEKGCLNDVWQIKPPKSKSKEISHAAKFPDELVEKILLNFSDENDIVYDPFLGTGTTAIVAQKLNRRYIGSEIMDRYYQYALSQLANS